MARILRLNIKRMAYQKCLSFIQENSAGSKVNQQVYVLNRTYVDFGYTKK